MASQRCEPAGVTLEDGTARNRPAREGLRRGRAGEDNDRRPPSEESPGSQGPDPGASRRGWSLKALAGGVFRLGVPYDGYEPAEMAVEGYQVRGHPAREESKTGLTDKRIGDPEIGRTGVLAGVGIVDNAWNIFCSDGALESVKRLSLRMAPDSLTNR